MNFKSNQHNMNRILPLNATLGGLFFFLMFSTSCKKDILEENISTETSSGPSISTGILTSLAYHPGRTLAANCFQCHGTNGYAGELKIANMSVLELTSKFNNFSSSDSKADIMNFHAQAYTPEEINLIVDFFSKQ